MSTVSIQLKYTQVSPTSIGTRQCITTKQQVVATYLFDWFMLDNFVLGQIGAGNRWSVWLSDRREILESIYRGARPGGSTGELGGRLDRRALPGSSTEDSMGVLDGRLDRNAQPGASTGGSMEGSTGGLDRMVLPRGLDTYQRVLQ